MVGKYEPKCYKVRLENQRFIKQYVQVVAYGVTLPMMERRVNDTWLPFCRRHKLDCKIDVNKVPCSEKGKIREFTYRRKRK